MLRIHNDGKERHQSFEAWVELPEDADIGMVEIHRGYGSTEDEAIQNFFENLEEQKKNIVKAFDTVIGSMHEKRVVAYDGKPIKKESHGTYRYAERK